MRIYYGWVVVAISMAIMALVLGTTMNAFGLFVIPASRDFGLSRADINTGIILVNLGVAGLAPVIGRMVDLFPVRRLMTGGALLLGGSLIGLGLSHDIWLSAFLLAMPLAIGIGAAGTLTTMTLVARWFAVHRARAMAFMAIGMSLGTVIMAPITGALIESVGWRYCLVILGTAVSLVLLLLIPFTRARPGEHDIEPGAQAKSGELSEPQPSAPQKPLSLGQLFSLAHFWVLALSVALAFGTMQAITVSLVPIAQEQGVAPTQAAVLLSTLGGTAILGKLVLAWIGDKINKAALLAALLSMIALACFGLQVAQGFGGLIVSSAALGLVVGAVLPIFLALLADRVGAASFGTANGIASLLMAVMGAVAIRFSGEIYDQTGGYELMFSIFAAICLASAVLTFLSGKLVPDQRASAA